MHKKCAIYQGKSSDLTIYNEQVNRNVVIGPTRRLRFYHVVRSIGGSDNGAMGCSTLIDWHADGVRRSGTMSRVVMPYTRELPVP